MPIRQLSQHMAELIAAGEVVERPASVVKELVENAIDAGATAVTVEIERGGIACIRITDNGCGFAAADIPLAFVRHATSKIETQNDLDAIGTLGFRGEALASIASVSRVELLTYHKSDRFATSIAVQGGNADAPTEGARGEGTTITVRDLFYNTPARMKFLKKDASEGGYVTETVTRLALSHPELAIRYLRDGKPVFATPGGAADEDGLRGTVRAVLGATFARELVPVHHADGPYAVHGLVTDPRAGRASRSMQYFFINGRFVKNRTMMAALEQAYRGMMMHGKFPGGVLFLQMPYELVDVNVHPAKTEVRFAREQSVFDAVYRAVKAGLLEQAGSYGSLQIPLAQSASKGDGNEGGHRPSDGGDTDVNKAGMGGGPPAALRQKPASQEAVAVYNRMVTRVAEEAESLESPQSVVLYQTARDVARQHTSVGAASGGKIPSGREEDTETESTEENTEGTGRRAVARGYENTSKQAALLFDDLVMEQQTMPGMEPAVQKAQLHVLGEVFGTYIVAETGDTLCLIDKHAAHERILYERFAAQKTETAAQQLLAPVSVQLSAEEKNALLQNAAMLVNVGIVAEDFGGNEVLVRAIPADVEPDDVENLVIEVAARLAENARDATNEKTQWVLHSIACRAAVKAGDHTPTEQLVALAADILAGKVPPFCPHGRPVLLKMQQKELEKQFGRLG